jgi:hypothetical protein
MLFGSVRCSCGRHITWQCGAVAYGPRRSAKGAACSTGQLVSAEGCPQTPALKVPAQHPLCGRLGPAERCVDAGTHRLDSGANFVPFPV